MILGELPAIEFKILFSENILWKIVQIYYILSCDTFGSIQTKVMKEQRSTEGTCLISNTYTYYCLTEGALFGKKKT